MKKQPKYLFYTTLLDAFQGYLSSSDIYQEYWGFSENPTKTEDEFEAEQLQSLLDRINRVPFDSEAADRGTAFNEVVDCIITSKTSEKYGIRTYENHGVIACAVNNRLFEFPISLCREFANYYKGALPQVHTEAILPTKYGEVLLYGYIDELMPMTVHDIKTTNKYSVGKFKRNWQHIVYPYCLCENGNEVREFEYNVAVFNQSNDMKFDTFTEHYNYLPERDIPKLTEHVEGLVEFVERNKELITDLKIFNKHE